VKRAVLFYSLLGIGLVAIAIAISFYFDATVRQFMVDHQVRAVRVLMENVSRFGDWPEHFVIGLLLLGVAWWRGNEKWKRIFLAMLIALAVVGLAGRVIKISAGRARPAVK